jgi:hypothetical protein
MTDASHECPMCTTWSSPPAISSYAFVRPPDPEHRRRLDDRQQQPFALLDVREMTHGGIHVRSRARMRDAFLECR